MDIGVIDKTLAAENADLRERLDEAESTLAAIRSGQVDALVIGDQVYTLESADAASNRFRGEVLAQINEAVVAIDNEDRLTYMNPAAEKQYGVAASDVLGRELKNVYRYIWLTDDAEQSASAALKNTGYWRGENIHIRPDGHEIYVESTVNVLRDRDDEPVGLLAVIRDITARKRAEEELQEAHDRLESRVAERTEQLAQANASLQNEMEQHVLAEREKAKLLKKVVTTQEDERRRIARDLHDQLGQRVTALRLQLASLCDAFAGDGAAMSKIEPLRDLAERLDSDVGFLAWELRPAALDDLGFADAAKAFLREWSRHYSVPADMHLSGHNDHLDADAETHLYRIMQEALNNIAKHANATHVNVLIKLSETDVSLIVEDNGVGFDPSAQTESRDSEKSLGLLGMRERAMLVGGNLQIESSVGHGTTIYVRVPFVSLHAYQSA